MYGPIFYGWLLSCALLIAEHFAFADVPKRLPAPVAYVVGVATLLAGCAVWARLSPAPVEPYDAFMAFAIISTSGGWVAGGYLWRHWKERRAQTHEQKAQAVRLTQELIDNGGHDADARQTGNHHHIRKN